MARFSEEMKHQIYTCDGLFANVIARAVQIPPSAAAFRPSTADTKY